MSSSQSTVKPTLTPSERLLNVPPYSLAKVFQDRDEKVRQGVDVIDLGVGNPDLRPPQHAIDALPEKVDHENHAQELEKLGIDPGELLATAGHRVLG